TSALAKLLARGTRSGVGTAGFDRGGLLVDAGPRDDGAVAPVVSHMEFPKSWRIVLALDDRQSGLHGGEEAYALERLQPFSRERAADISHLLMMQLLPAVAEAEFDAFARALTAIQASIGGYFAPAQGGSMYTSASVGRCLEWVAQHFAAGVGQSS